jgi:hypothetical protein
MAQFVITWNTKKLPNGTYSFRVYTVGYQVESVTLQTGVCQTRARASGSARRWVRYFKAKQQAEVLAAAADPDVGFGDHLEEQERKAAADAALDDFN